MPSEPCDIVALGDAIVDVIARTSDRFLDEAGITKGTMRLLADGEAEALAASMARLEVEEIPGGSAANTLAGVAALGTRAGFIGQIGADRLGRRFADDLAALGIAFDTPPVEAPTGRCFILVTPDAQRTMQTSPGASHRLSADALDEDAIRGARLLFLEGYLWGPARPRAAMARAIALARGEGRQIAFTISDSIALPGRRESLVKLCEDGGVDILFANAYEACLLAGVSDLQAAMKVLSRLVPTLVVTRGAAGALAQSDGGQVEIDAFPAERIVDTTGAGDQFAAGFLAAHVAGRDLQACLEGGGRAAAAVIAHVGARPMIARERLMPELSTPELAMPQAIKRAGVMRVPDASTSESASSNPSAEGSEQ